MHMSAGGEFYYGIAALRRSSKRRLDRVPDKPRTVSAHPLPANHLRAGDVGGEGLPRAEQRRRDHQRVLRAISPDGEV